MSHRTEPRSSTVRGVLAIMRETGAKEIELLADDGKLIIHAGRSRWEPRIHPGEHDHQGERMSAVPRCFQRKATTQRRASERLQLNLF